MVHFSFRRRTHRCLFLCLLSRVKSEHIRSGERPCRRRTTVISTGVYGLVRHPMYFGALFLVVGTPLALGSWWTLLLILLFLPILYFRIANEEKVLLRDLQGYEEYRNKVRYRLIPYVW